MSSISIPELPLTSGDKIPAIALGTAASPPVAEAIIEAVLEAIRLGVRHFDTASIYQSEEPLGQAIAEALRLGLITSRAELFITTKLWCSDAHGDLVVPALQKSLRNLKMEYVDLYLIHWPVSSTPGSFIPTKEGLLPFDMKGVWAAMEECHKLGLAKSIGVSNFSCKKLGDLLAFANIPPSVNQVEMNPIWQQKKLLEFSRANGVLLEAFSPLGGLGTPWGTNTVMESEVLNEIAKAKGKTVAQICLRWAFEQGVVVVFKSYNKERIKQNLEIFGWGLSEEEIQKIDEIPQKRHGVGEGFISDDGPIKSAEELWDGEI